MAIYEDTHDSLMLEELHIYGSQRLGIIKENRLLAKYVNIFPPSSTFKTSMPNTPLIPYPYTLTPYHFGKKHYELSDWLGNVRVVINDKKTPQGTNASDMTYAAQVLEVNDYYPFGMLSRNYFVSEYRYGFNKQERDDEISGEGNVYTFKYRVHDARLGRFFSVDPLAKNYPWNSAYAFAENDVIRAKDLEGLEKGVVIYSVFLNGDKTTINIQRAEMISSKGENIQLNLRAIQNGNFVEQKSQFDQNKYLVVYHVFEDNKRKYSIHFQKEELNEIEKNLDVKESTIQEKYIQNVSLDIDKEVSTKISINSDKNSVKVDKPFRVLKYSKTLTIQEYDNLHARDKEYGCYTCDETGSYEKMSKPPGFHQLRELENSGDKTEPSNNIQNKNNERKRYE